MNQLRVLRFAPVAFALALGFAGPLALTGCGSQRSEEMVVPEVPPEEKAKASMDYYINNQLNQAPQR